MPDIITQSQVVPTLGEFGEFDTITGGFPQGNYQEYYPAGAKFPRLISSTGKYTDIVLTRGYIAGRDGQLVDWWRRKMSGVDPVPRTVTKQFRNAIGIVEDLISFSVYIGDVELPDGKAGDNTVAMVKVTLKVENMI